MSIAKWLVEEIEAVTPSWGVFEGRHYTVKNYDPVWRDDIFLNARKLTPLQLGIIEAIGADTCSRIEINNRLETLGYRPRANDNMSTHLADLVALALLDMRAVRRNGRIQQCWCKPKTEIH